jgi:hypothetical protein
MEQADKTERAPEAPLPLSPDRRTGVPFKHSHWLDLQVKPTTSLYDKANIYCKIEENPRAKRASCLSAHTHDLATFSL